MKKTLKFDDGSILVGSSSTFTVTQEDQGKIDIFDMPSKYIWISNRDTLDGADDYQGDTIYIGISVLSFCIKSAALFCAIFLQQSY